MASHRPLPAQRPPRFVTVALGIAGKDLRQRMRDRSALIVALVAPALMASLISLAFRGTESIHIRLGLVDADGGPAAAAVRDALAGPELSELVTAVPLASVEEARAALDKGSVGAALVVPGGFSAAALSAAPAELEVLTSVDRRLAGAVATSIAKAFAGYLDAVRLSVAASPAGDPVAAASFRPAVELAPKAVGAKAIRSINYFGPSMALFFLFFVVGFGARSWFAERREGTWGRLRAAPVSPAALVIGKALSVAVNGLAILVVMVAVTSVAFGADWGDPLPVALLSVAIVAAMTCLCAAVITLARTERQAEAISSVLVFGLAILGGNFIVITYAPSLMRRLALLTPNGWALRGYVELAGGGHGLAAIAEPLRALALFSLVTAAIAAWRSRRMAAA